MLLCCVKNVLLRLWTVSSPFPFLLVAFLFLIPPLAQATTYVLGTTAITVGSGSGSSSVTIGVTPTTGSWTASTNATWLHLTPANQSGVGGTNVIFSFDANAGSTRSGTLTIGGLGLTITQAGSTYSPVTQVFTLIPASVGMDQPNGVARDGAGNVFVADTINNLIRKWTLANNTVTTLASNTYGFPSAVAADNAGNVYFCLDGFDLDEWVASSQSISGVGSGLFDPAGMSTSVSGTLYIADSSDNAIKTFNGGFQTLISGLYQVNGVSADAAGNVYFVQSASNTVYKWTASTGTQKSIIQGLSNPKGVAVDGGGNVYVANSYGSDIEERSAIDGSISVLPIYGFDVPSDLVVDSAGDLYISDLQANVVDEVPHVFVDTTSKFEGANAGTDTLPPVLPTTADLLKPFNPTASQSWLTIASIANGIVSFSFAANPGSARTASINFFGRSVSVTQAGARFSLATTGRLEGPTPGSDSVVLAVVPSVGAWAASANASWLHVSAGSQSGAGSANVIFSYDANPGSTRTGTIGIASQTLTVTQAGTNYVPVQTVSVLVASNHLSQPEGLDVDATGNVYIADTGDNGIKRWNVSDQTLTNVVNGGLVDPGDVTVDSTGNIYIANTDDNSILELTPGSTAPVYIISQGLDLPFGIAVDNATNIFIADTGHNAIKKWSPGNTTPAGLVTSGLNSPLAVTLDAAGNVYFVDTGNEAVKKWTAATGNVTTLFTTNLTGLDGIAVDVGGNVYVASP